MSSSVVCSSVKGSERIASTSLPVAWRTVGYRVGRGLTIDYISIRLVGLLRAWNSKRLPQLSCHSRYLSIFFTCSCCRQTLASLLLVGPTLLLPAFAARHE